MSRRRPATLHGWALLLLVATLATASREPLRVAVGAEPLGPISPLATAGFNYGNAMRIVGYEEAFDALRVGTLRFPPGNQADEIRLGKADLDVLEANLDLLGRPPVLMVANLFGGTPEQAAELARSVAARDIPVLAWEVGNEPDLYASNRNAPSWTPERWCRAFRAFRAALREADPDAVLAGPAVSGARPGGETFLREVLDGCGDAIDLLTWHVYPTDGTWSDEAALATADRFAEEAARYRAWAEDAAHNPRGHEAPPRLGVTEFGLSWRSAAFRHLEDMTAALWLAQVLGEMSATGLEVSHYFTLQGMGGHGLVAVGGWVRPTHTVFAMLAGFTGVALPVRTPPPLRAYAARQGDRTEVLLVNPSQEPHDVQIDLPAPAGGDLRIATLTDAIHARLGGAELRHAPPRERIHVPPRAVVHLRAPASPR